MRTLIALLLCTLALVARDHVTLKTGVLVEGDVISVHRQGFLIRTDQGTRFIPWDALGGPGLQTTSEVAVALANGDRITARITCVEDHRLVMTTAFIPEARVPTSALRPRPMPGGTRRRSEFPGEPLQDDKTDDLLKQKDWNGNIALLGTFRNGNTDSALFQLNAVLKRQWATDRFNTEMSASWGRTEGDQTAQNVLGGAKWDHFYDADFYSYGRVEAEHDEIKNLEIRLTTGLGAGLNVWRGDDEHRSLDLEVGVDYLHQRFDGADTSADIAGRFAFIWESRFFENWLLTEDFEILLPAANPGGFILHSQTRLETALVGDWYLQNILDIEYRGEVPTDTSNLDIKLLMGLEYKF